MNKRIPFLDTCRGLMLLSMSFNHLIFLPFLSFESVFQWVIRNVYGAYGYFSNSEGFFFLAGLITGIVYGRMVVTERESEIRPRIVKRIGIMYAGHVIMLACFTMCLILSKDYMAHWKSLHSLIDYWKVPGGYHYFLDHPYTAFFKGCFFLYLPIYFDIIPVYILFLAITPFVLRMLKKEKIFYVLSISLICWIIAQYWSMGRLEQTIMPYMTVKLVWFHPLAQQMLFFGGLTLGFLHVQGRRLHVNRIFFVVGIVLCLLLIGLRSAGIDIHHSPHLGILRLLTFTAKAYIMFLIHRFVTLRPLALLGRYSLPVFNYHIALTYFLIFFLPFISALPMYSKLLLFVLSLLSLWLPAYILEKRRSLAFSSLETSQKAEE